MNVWYILGIDPASDADTIRKAYAQKIRQFHPEEHPLEFQRLNEAYRKALAMSSVAGGQPPIVCNVTNDSAPVPENGNDSSPQFSFDAGNGDAPTEEERYDFNAFPAESLQYLERQEQLLILSVLNKTYTLLSGGNSQMSVWNPFLNSEEFLHVMDTPEFINELTKLLYKDFYTIRPAVYDALRRTYFRNKIRNVKLAPYRQLAHLLPMLKARSRARHPNHKITIAVIAIPIVFVLAASLSFIKNGGPDTSSASVTMPTFSIKNPLLPSDQPSSKDVNDYLNRKYPGIEFNVPGEAESNGLTNAYHCSLPEYDGLEFDVYQYIYSADTDSGYDNLIEAALEKALASAGLEGAYDGLQSTVYLPVKNGEELKTLSAMLPELPDTFLVFYPFAKGSELYLAVLPADAPYPYPNGCSLPLLYDNGWFSDEIKALDTVQHMLDLYISDYMPWTSAEHLQQSLQYGEPVTVLVDSKPQTFADVRVENDAMTAGSFYRLCLHLDIPVKAESNGDFVVGTEKKRVSLSQQGNLFIDDVSNYLGITLGTE